jgi:hypothetical protein
MIAHCTTAEILKCESDTLSERDSIALREIFRLKQSHESYPLFTQDMLIKLVYRTQFGPSLSKEFLEKVNRKSSYEETLPLIRNGKLFLTDFII